jgi:hypothetical protein
MTMTAKEPEILRCSFCNKDQNDVRKLIAGPTVFICDECVGVCNDIIADDARLTLPQGQQAHEPPVSEIARATATTGLALKCALCGMPTLVEEGVAVEHRGVLCAGCVQAIEAALATRSGLPDC